MSHKSEASWASNPIQAGAFGPSIDTAIDWSACPRTRSKPVGTGFVVLAALLLGLVAAAPVSAEDWIYTVRPGDTLWQLTDKYLDGRRYMHQLQEYNNVANPRKIPPGTRLKLPIAWLRIQPAPAKALVVTGRVDLVRRDNAAVVPVGVGTGFTSGDRIRTAPDSSVTVGFADGSRLLVQQGSGLTFDTLSAYSGTGMVDTSLRLDRGRVENRVMPPKGPASRYRISTPAAVAATRGTRFRVNVDDSGELMRGEVLESAIVVTGGGVEKELPEDFGLVAKAGEPPSEPTPLLPAPDLSLVAVLHGKLDLALEWPALAGAEAYRAQLLDSREQLLVDMVTEQSSATLRAPADGKYRLRVRAADNLGLEGHNAARLLLVKVLPDPPVVRQPADGVALLKPPRLQWSIAPNATTYDVQVAADSRFSRVVMVRRAYRGDGILVDVRLDPGTYFWRVASRGANGNPGLYSAARSFRLQQVPKVVQIPSARIEDTQLRFTWGPSAGAERYEFELARGTGFAEIVERAKLDKTSTSVNRPGRGAYAWRVRGISAEGIPGPYSMGSIELLTDP